MKMFKNTNIINLVEKTINQAERWKNAKANLSEEQCYLINNLLTLKEKLSTAGINYIFYSPILPTVSMQNAKDEAYFEKPITQSLVSSSSTNEQKWNYIKKNAQPEVVSAMQELFEILDKLSKSGVDYHILTDKNSINLPTMKEGSPEPSPFQLI